MLVSKMLGHASVKQTADTYTHVSPTMHREAASTGVWDGG